MEDLKRCEECIHVEVCERYWFKELRENCPFFKPKK